MRIVTWKAEDPETGELIEMEKVELLAIVTEEEARKLNQPRFTENEVLCRIKTLTSFRTEYPIYIDKMEVAEVM